MAPHVAKQRSIDVFHHEPGLSTCGKDVKDARYRDGGGFGDKSEGTRVSESNVVRTTTLGDGVFAESYNSPRELETLDAYFDPDAENAQFRATQSAQARKIELERLGKWTFITVPDWLINRSD
ncbi:hypothetical protein Hypma_010978 [Hypsizygus marmoreus]|uniref:Uncharacterized protein n=1 Tax=Hypsizygus marmoreus TaxID=39966 RepID=A0A369JTN2_HYPMA|nr:hypothetical protein Hypma_010978 [Hypsizygus marmoreus]